jgi:hypothetical protein
MGPVRCRCGCGDDLWHQRIAQWLDQARELTESGLFSPAEVLASLVDAERAGELPGLVG